MIAAGIPVFAAPPCPAANGGTCGRPRHHLGREEYDLPPHWEKTIPAIVNLERWQPGWGLAAVGGHAADFLDEDPRARGDEAIAELLSLGQMPRIYGVQQTPSGGRHYLIAPLGERKCTPLPGLDYQGGDSGGRGRAFVWIAPTVRRSKVDGQRRAYAWTQPPDTEWLAEGGDESGELLLARVQAVRARVPEQRTDTGAPRQFTEQQAQTFCNITLQRLMQAPIGQIEEAANNAAVQLSHFVPHVWSEEFAYEVLFAALGETAYDPEHPASTWTADKFHAVLSGQRAPNDWHAVKVPEPAAPGDPLPEPEPSAVDALLAEMLTPAQVLERPRPHYLIQGLLNLDSESWIIGPAGSKKSFVVLDMAARIAAGQQWQGLKTRRSPVVIIAAEGAGGLGNRIAAWEKAYGPMSPDIHILPRPVQSADRPGWSVLVEACRRLAPGLIVADTQARVTVGLEENSATDMGVYVEAVRAAREATGACVLSVHHTGRRGGDARGSSAIDGAQHTELKVTADGLHGTLAVEKQKDMEMRGDMPLLFEYVDLGLDEEDEPLGSLVLVDDPFRIAAGAEPTGQGVTPWMPTFHEKDKWRRRVLEVLYRMAPHPQGWLKSDLEGFMKKHYADFDRNSGSWKRVLKELREQYDPDGEPVLLPSASRWGVASPSVREALALEFEAAEQDQELD